MAKHEAVAFDKNGKALYIGDTVVANDGEIFQVQGFTAVQGCSCSTKSSQVRKATKKEAAVNVQKRATEADTVIWGN